MHIERSGVYRSPDTRASSSGYAAPPSWSRAEFVQYALPAGGEVDKAGHDQFVAIATDLPEHIRFPHKRFEGGRVDIG